MTQRLPYTICRVNSNNDPLEAWEELEDIPDHEDMDDHDYDV